MLERTIHTYWELGDALSETRKRKNYRLNIKTTIDSLRSEEFDKFDNVTAAE
jgi:hypothetical protein